MEKQFPPKETCNGIQLAVNNFHGLNGLGLVIHVVGLYLGIAAQNGRVFVYSNTGDHLVQSNLCHEQNLNCIFQPISSCSILNAHGNNTKFLNYPSSNGPDDMPVPSIEFVPDVWVQKLKHLMAPAQPQVAYLKYWWRTQSAAFIMRLNGATLHALQQLRLNASLH